MKRVKVRDLLDNMKSGYIIFYAIFLTLNKFILFQSVPHIVISVIYGLLAAGGAVLLVIDFFTDRDMFRVPGNSILFLYMLVILLSSVVNAKYGIFSNFKTLVWSVIQIFLLGAIQRNTESELRKKHILTLFHIIGCIWLVGVIISFFEFSIDYSGLYVLPDGGVRRQGFVDGRLFGEFTDPNLAAVFSICIIIMIIYELAHCETSIVMKIYAIVNLIFQIIYVVLSNSRTAIVISVACCLAGTILILSRRLHKLHWRVPIKVICVLSAGIIASAALFGSIYGLKTVFILIPRKNPAMIQQIDSVVSKLPTAYVPELDERPAFPDDDDITMDRDDVDYNKNISNNRFQIWSGYLDVFKHVPILGTSPRNALAVADHFFPAGSFILQRQYSIHNGYLAVLVCTGITGAAVVAAWIFYILKVVSAYLIRKYKAEKCEYSLVLTFVLIELTLAISAFFMMGIFFGNSILELIFWYTVGNLLSTIQKDAPELFKKDPLTYRICEKIFSRKRELS